MVSNQTCVWTSRHVLVDCRGATDHHRQALSRNHQIELCEQQIDSVKLYVRRPQCWNHLLNYFKHHRQAQPCQYSTAFSPQVMFIKTTCKSLSALTAIFPGEPGLAGFIGAKDDGSDGDNWSCCETCKASVKSSPPTNQHPVFLQAGCPSCRPTNSVQALKIKNHL